MMSLRPESPSSPIGQLEGQVVLITGGTRGIGRAVAFRLARERPAQLVLGYCLDHEAARHTRDELRALGVPTSIRALDVSKPELMTALFEQVAAEHGGVDVFISNAARTSFRAATELSLRAWQKIMDLNVRAYLQGAQLAAGQMRTRGGGSIVAMSSLGSRFALPRYAGLGVAKAAIESLTRYLAVELATDGIRVNAVCGGFVDSESLRLAPDYDQIMAAVAEHNPAGRVAKPEDLAGAVAFLCLPDARWIQGQTLVVDGGESLCLW